MTIAAYRRHMAEPKERVPKVVKRSKIAERPPIRPFGTVFEFWSGVLGIARDLTIFDGESPTAYIEEMSARDRKILAAYMIALWKRFEAGK